MRLNLAIPFTALLVAGTCSCTMAQRFGWTAEPLVPVGTYAKAIDVGWGFGGYGGVLLGSKRHAKWALTLGAGVQWHAGNDADLTDFPNAPQPQDDQIKISGWMFPITGSITRFFGRTYFSPKAGVFIPAGHLTSKLGFKASPGVSPRLGYLFPISRDLSADVALEYSIIFDEMSVMYFALSFGFITGGRRFPRARIPF